MLSLGLTLICAYFSPIQQWVCVCARHVYVCVFDDQDARRSGVVCVFACAWVRLIMSPPFFLCLFFSVCNILFGWRTGCRMCAVIALWLLSFSNWKCAKRNFLCVVFTKTSSYISTSVLLNCSITEVRPTFDNSAASSDKLVEKKLCYTMKNLSRNLWFKVRLWNNFFFFKS